MLLVAIMSRDSLTITANYDLPPNALPMRRLTKPEKWLQLEIRMKRSQLTISLIKSSNVTVGFHPSSFRALLASPSNWSTSAGLQIGQMRTLPAVGGQTDLKYLGSTLTTA